METQQTCVPETWRAQSGLWGLHSCHLGSARIPWSRKGHQQRRQGALDLTTILATSWEAMVVPNGKWRLRTPLTFNTTNRSGGNRAAVLPSETPNTNRTTFKSCTQRLDRVLFPMPPSSSKEKGKNKTNKQSWCWAPWWAGSSALSLGWMHPRVSQVTERLNRDPAQHPRAPATSFQRSSALTYPPRPGVHRTTPPKQSKGKPTGLQKKKKKEKNPLANKHKTSVTSDNS